MKLILRTVIEDFLRSEGYALSNEMCSHKERKIYDCWLKGGFPKLKLLKTQSYFQPSELSKIFHDRKMEDRFKLTLK